ncbi:MAG TPA: methyltransferase domain-containing protein [Candidatus Krumholzibacterium sp.]|nr:methyltransferase domain-containing protein [Candidatus Krumholzibacterium sp.]
MDKDLGPVRIKKVVYGGLGLTYHEGQTLFIPFTAPDDLVTFDVTARKKKVIFGNPSEVVEPSPMRIEAECPVFGRCGGCQFLHIGYEDELGIKKENVLESLERIGGVTTVVDSLTPSPSRDGYRNNCVIHVDGEGRPGFRMRESSEVVPFPGQGCLLLPTIMREAISALPDEAFPPGGEVRARTDCFGKVHFWGLKDHISPPDVLVQAGGYQFPLAPDSFFQVNSLLNDRFIELVLSLPSKAPRRLLDLYCGTGFFSFAFSKLAEEVIGIERHTGSYRGALAAKRLNRVSNVSFRKGSVEREIFRTGETDVIVADPPRSGMPPDAVRGMLKLRPSEIILISCEPPTFARDAKKLIEAGYMLNRLHIIDMFPSTYHVETVGLFRK